MNKKPTLICFGEVLWDVFPEGTRIGGAPLNVAYHINQLGLISRIISKVGVDANGKKLLDQIKAWGLSTAYCQEDSEQSTSEVIAKVGADGDTTYTILAPVAWDFIEWTSQLETLVSTADVLVFGSLAARLETSRNTLFKLIDKAKYKVFDVNLRPPHYTKERILKLLRKTDLVKVNHEELEIIAKWIDPDVEGEKAQIDLLFQSYPIAEVLVSKGADGASHYRGEATKNAKAFPVDVVNTVGSGDAFLAGFLSEKFGNPTSIVEQQLTKAALLGAFVAGKDRACPSYTTKSLDGFKAGTK